jgi:hypothetical protein
MTVVKTGTMPDSTKIQIENWSEYLCIVGFITKSTAILSCG